MQLNFILHMNEIISYQWFMDTCFCREAELVTFKTTIS